MDGDRTAGDAAGSDAAVSDAAAGAATTAAYPTRDSLEQECDLVMKGGIASGVVYPLAVCQLARSYRFRCVGGSSAGAIAATLAAAAEYGRDSGGFQRLAALPDEIAPKLPELIQPGPHTPGAHAVLMAMVDRAAGRRAKLWHVVRTLLRAQRWVFWPVLVAALILLMGLAVVTAGGAPGGLAAVGFGILLALLAAIALAVALGAAAGREGRATMQGLARQGFGICVGSAGAAEQVPGGPEHLTDWLASRIDSVAGVNRPLRFGDLASVDIDLQVTTTNLTHGRAVTFPFTGERAVLFDPIELGDYFPPAIIASLVGDRSPATRDGGVLRSPEGAELYTWPDAGEVPIVVAARLSLSFPGLISAVPLYRIDYSREREADRQPIRCWFSDGGITSNFPVHFFDSLWPNRPTFALDLSAYHPDHPDRDVYYGGTTLREPRTKQIRTVGGFFAAILDTMQSWADDAQAALPGYRDRIVEVHLRDDEGGMNLTMPPETVRAAAGRGQAATAELAERFDLDQHRWTRYLTAMGELQEVIVRMQAGYDAADSQGAGGGYRDLISAAPSRAAYPRDAEWVAEALGRTDTLLVFAESDVPDFSDWSAGPAAVLRITPKL
jgi:predicted acylesterase/phospholipase RssA